MGGGGGAARRASSSAVAVAVAAVVVMLAGAAGAAVYEVGDKSGWTIMGKPNYAAWAKGKKFHVGDVVVFTYLKQFHNVMAVSKTSYSSCETSKPIATWSTGNDSVVLNTTGPHYFLCGYPGHCAAGQKVEIDVRSGSSSSAAPSESPAVAPSPAGSSSSGTEPSSSGGAAPSPHGNAAPARTLGGSVALAASVLSMVAAAVLA